MAEAFSITPNWCPESRALCGDDAVSLSSPVIGLRNHLSSLPRMSTCSVDDKLMLALVVGVKLHMQRPQFTCLWMLLPLSTAQSGTLQSPVDWWLVRQQGALFSKVFFVPQMFKRNWNSGSRVVAPVTRWFDPRSLHGEWMYP